MAFSESPSISGANEARQLMEAAAAFVEHGVEPPRTLWQSELFQRALASACQRQRDAVIRFEFDAVKYHGVLEIARAFGDALGGAKR